jgi:hypothetical protein
MSIDNIFQWLWYQQFRNMHPELPKSEDDVQKLRIILGAGRSGTTWLSSVLSKTPTPIRFFMEGLYSVKPKLRFSAKSDRTAIEYRSNLPERHPLLCAYRLLLASRYDRTALGLGTTLVRNDLDWQLCLIKEVHSLLATEALLRFFKCPIVCLIRDPVYVIDSLFARDGLKSMYFENERKAVVKPDFLKRFAPDQSESISRIIKKSVTGKRREKIILGKVLTVALINSMFRVLADESQYVHLIEYEVLCRSPKSVFRTAAKFLTLDWDNNIESFLSRTSQVNLDKEHEFSFPVFRQTQKQINRKFKFLSQNEASLSRQVLSDSGLT